MGVFADNQSSSMHVGSQGSGGYSTDGQCSSPVQSSLDDDNVSDEDFRVDEAEMHTVSSSDSSEDEGKSKKKAKAKKINERFLDEFNDNYLQFLSCHHGSSNSIQGENAEIFCSSVNGGKRKRGRPRKNRSPGNSFHLNSKSGATKKRGRPPKNKIEVISFDSEAKKDSIGEFEKSDNGGSRKGGMVSHFEDIDDGDELYLEWLRSHGLSSGCGNAGNRKRGRPPKNWNKGFDSERGCERTSGRPPKNLNKGMDSERCCRRSRRLQTMSRK